MYYWGVGRTKDKQTQTKMSETVVMVTTQIVSDSKSEQTIKIKEEKRFPGEANMLTCEDNVHDSGDDWEQDGVECPICCRCDCGSQVCELEIERQEFYAEYWADF